MAEAGVSLAFGSDWPVVALRPLLGAHAAAWRMMAAPAAAGKTCTGSDFANGTSWPWIPEEAVDVEYALAAHTRAAAAALMLSDYVGILR